MYIEAFHRYIRFEKRYSIHTFTAYSQDLGEFYLYLSEQYELAEEQTPTIAHPMIRSWIVSLMNTGITTRTINRKISTLKSYFKFLLREKYMEQNPVSKIQSPKVSKRLPVFVNEVQMEELFVGIEFEENFSGVRDRLVLELLYGTGMRLSEMINLKMKDLDLYQETIKVLGKRNKERIIPVNKSAVILVKKYLELRPEIVTSDIQREELLVTDKGEKTYPVFIYRLVKKYLGMITTLEKRSPHVLRHTFATHLLNNGAGLSEIKELLGHANLSATQVYTHNSVEKLKNIYKQAHPKGQ